MTVENSINTAPWMVFFEGLSCSGKSTLLQTVASNRFASIFKQWLPNSQPTLEFFLERDEDKLARARAVSGYEAVLVDRGYLSTLVFYQVLQEQRGIPSVAVLNWFINNLGDKLYRPDFYVFVDVPPEVSLQRARKARNLDENNMWLHFPKRIQYWYERLYEVFESGTPKHHLDGTLPPDTLSTEFERLMSQLPKKEMNATAN